MSEPFGEYRDITITDPLRQGDVLEAVSSEVSKWQRHLLVITADCDFAHDKHEGRVTCVPLLRSDEYLLEMQVPRIREKYIRNKLLPALERALENAGAPRVSPARLRAWPLESDVDEIVESLALAGNEAEVASAAFTAMRLLGQACMSLDDAVRTLVDAQLAGPSPQKRNNIIKSITEALKGPYLQPPGDALFLSAISPQHDAGYFAYLRHLEQVWQPEIALGPSRRDVRYRRISRLQDRYTLAMAQRFALVFMSIGLPNEYEEIRDLHAELLGESYK